jgi:hypothetical protein
MNCEESLLEQAIRTKEKQSQYYGNSDGHVWVYRNSVKALPWFSLVREKLEDKRYWGWFLPLENCTDGIGGYTCGPNVTDNLYHDFEQTPTGDCGYGIECGEYLFDHRK